MTKRILITGATAGIGLDTARQIAAATKSQDVEIILANRNPEKADKVKAELAGITANPISLFTVDFDRLDSVKDCANELAAQYDSLDVLINNAGLFAPKQRKTADGFEKHIGVNYLAPVLFTEKLLPLLQNADKPRIVHVASMAHLAARNGIQFDDFKGWQPYNAAKAYGHSKLANLLYSKALAKRLAANADTAHITSNAMHPGGAASSIYRDMPTPIRQLMGLVSISTKKSAQRIEKMALSPQWAGKNGQYSSVQTPAWQSKHAKNAALADKLMAHTDELLAAYV